ncbi:Protein sel-1 homolog 1 [Coccomyxa sp. Obi]|nr:Protein sel-1 homolog 1 [Coccomyxa sp. Obi]
MIAASRCWKLLLRSVQELLALFRELDEYLGPGDVWLHGYQREDAVSELVRGQGWMEVDGAEDASGDVLLRSGMAAFLLASLASNGFASPLVPRDDAFAVHALRQAMSASDLGAQMALSDRYLHGRGVVQNCTEGMRLARGAAEILLQEAEEVGSTGKQPLEAPLLRHRLRDGSYPWRLWDPATIAAYYDEAAGDGEGILGALGLMGARGAGGNRGALEELQDVQARAAGGDPYAMLELADRLVHGDMVPQNHAQALVLYQAAADLGDPGGLMALGYMHLHGLGTHVNVSVAIDFYEGAASMGYADACYYLGSLYGGLYGGVAFDRINLTLSEEKYQCAYTGNHYKAPYMLALIHEAGLGVPQNCTKAARYMRVVLAERSDWSANIQTAVKAHDEGDDWKALVMLGAAAEQGSAVAMHNAAFLLQRGRGYNGSDAAAMALELLLRAAAIEHQYGDGLVDAANLLLDADRYGIPGGANHSRALALYEAAAERHDVEAMTSLAWMHAAGVGTPANSTRALQLYWNAVERAPDAAHAAAPFLAYWWLHALVMVGLRLQEGGTEDERVRHDVLNICILLGALWLVLWLRQNRSANAAARRQ